MTLKHTDQRIIQFSGYRQELVAYATRLVADRSRAEDLVQDAFLKLDALPIDQVIDNPAAYMRRMVRNLCIDWIRKAKSEQRLVVADLGYEAVAENAASPERVLIDSEELQVVLAALEELPEKAQRAVRLHRLEGWTLSQIANELAISTTQAHGLIHRALEHCRQRLARRR